MGVNRDINNTQTITRDETHGGVDVRLNVDNNMVANPGEYVQAVREAPKNLKRAGRHVGNITKAHYLDTKRQVQGNEIVRGTYMNNSEVDSYVDTNGEYAVGAHTQVEQDMENGSIGMGAMLEKIDETTSIGDNAKPSIGDLGPEEVILMLDEAVSNSPQNFVEGVSIITNPIQQPVKKSLRKTVQALVNRKLERVKK